MSLPLVTIITPTYNRADFLVETIESVLGQDYPNIEYIVLDDGSNDNTADIVKLFEGKITYSYHNNMGETATVNKGFEIAKGSIVCVVNSDDPLFVNNAVSTAVGYLNENPDALMAYPDWVSIDEYGKVIQRKTLPNYTLENMIESAKVIIGPGMFIRKAAIEKIGLRNKHVRYVGDLDYSFRLAAAGKIIHIPHFLATHRVHAGGLSLSARGKRMADELATLGESYIDHPSLPHRIKHGKKSILAKWYLASMYYAGSDIKIALLYLLKAIRCSPVPALLFFWTAIIKKIKKSVFRFSAGSAA